MFGLLQIYDADDDDAEDRDGVSLSVGVTGGPDGFVRAMKQLAAAGRPFSRVVVETHGGPGFIKFDDRSVFDITLRREFKDVDFSKLFPLYTRIYFNGCNVAQNGSGWEFLETAGAMFLRAGGGEVFAHTSAGYRAWSWLPVIGGHTVHYGGDTRYVEIAPGGRVVRRYSPQEEDRKQRVGERFSRR